MFDGKSFLRSKTYFQLEQLCRIFSSSIEETIQDIQQTQFESLHEFKALFEEREGFVNEFEALSNEWGERTTFQVAKLNIILDRIRRKKEEVISLRDGVSSASSLTIHTSANITIAF